MSVTKVTSGLPKAKWGSFNTKPKVQKRIYSYNNSEKSLPQTMISFRTKMDNITNVVKYIVNR